VSPRGQRPKLVGRAIAEHRRERHVAEKGERLASLRQKVEAGEIVVRFDESIILPKYRRSNGRR
jgi:hypothetical protein